jgi:SAM-dependent methyltransferase
MDANGWDSKYDTEEYVFTTTVNRFVEEYCSDLEAGSMIDLAGGEGRNAVWFAERGWQVENIDFSKKALAKSLKLAKERGVSKLHFAILADATGFESVLTPVDLGVIAYLQLDSDSLHRAIENLVENIKDGGTLFGVWHARDNLTKGFGGPQNPEVLPTVESLRAICADLPLEIEEVTNRDGQVQTRDGLKPSITVVLKARVSR